VNDTNDYAWLDFAIAESARNRLDLPDQIRAIALELTAERGFKLTLRSAYSLVALALIATPQSLAPLGQAEFTRRYIVQTAAHHSASSDLAGRL
jgi:hypothetical protein